MLRGEKASRWFQKYIMIYLIWFVLKMTFNNDRDKRHRIKIESFILWICLTIHRFCWLLVVVRLIAMEIEVSVATKMLYKIFRFGFFFSCVQISFDVDVLHLYVVCAIWDWHEWWWLDIRYVCIFAVVLNANQKVYIKCWNN